MTARRKIWLAAVVVAAVAIGLLLNFHKDLIQSRNVHKLIAEGLDGRLLPHRINRLEKLVDIYGAGIRSCETDVMFRQTDDVGRFEVGHDSADNIGCELELFLRAIAPHGITKVWLDFKNLTDSNFSAALAELERLDSLYGLREVAIIESTFRNCRYRRFREAGFHTGYYLPTGRLSDMLARGNRDGLREAAEEIARQLDCQDIAAITFDLALYPFVKDFLEPLIPDTVVYHTWGAVKMWHWGELKELEGQPYFNDSRVRSILYRYW